MQKDIIIDNLIDIWKEKEIVKKIPSEGISMYPLIRQGDNISIKFCNPNKIKVGDIVAFKRGTTTVVHRILKKIDDKTLLEKGDFQLKGTSINHETLLGKVLISNMLINKIMGFLELLVHKTSSTRLLSKFFLIFPFTINYLSFIIYKICKNKIYI